MKLHVHIQANSVLIETNGKNFNLISLGFGSGPQYVAVILWSLFLPSPSSQTATEQEKILCNVEHNHLLYSKYKFRIAISLKTVAVL